MCCNCENKNQNTARLDGVLDAYGGSKGNLITVLQKAQDIYGYLPSDAVKHIAERMEIPPAKVLGVATFYAQFRLKPVGKYLILLCQGTACHVNGSSAIEDEILSFLSTPDYTVREGETTPDGLFTLKNVACLGCCSLSPVMMINGETYGGLTKEKTRKILQGLADAEKAAGGAV
ncbi:MAG: NADH-quinone oxidoreductase subunit NuoE [Firmicutes bacterium]|nr:NADH-quinone oxidoreductase subunit NuoE [Bacillota bacterium]